MHESTNALTWLLDVSAKASLLLAMIWLGAFFLRKRSAAAQHRWWTLGFVGSLLIPVVSLVAPTWTPPLVPALLQVSKPAVNVSTESVPPAFEVTDLDADTRLGRRFDAAMHKNETLGAPLLPPDENVPPVQKRERPKVSGVDADGVASARGWPSIAFSWPGLLLFSWGAGVGVVVLRSVRQYWLLNRMLARCAMLQERDWSELLDEASRMLGLRAKIALLENNEANSPVALGVWQPVVILPRDARNWDRERRRLVLLHELAHIARRDVLTQTLAGLGCALQWFNPLSWYGLSQMRKLREVACDDLVLSCGQPATGYADVLLDIARTYRHRTYANAVGMARSKDVERRIMAILDKTRQHVSLSPTSARMLFAFAAALVCLVGTAQLRSQAGGPDEKAITAAEEQKASDKPADATGDDEQMRTLAIRILDEEGEPLEGALLRVGTWYVEGYDGERVPKEHHADATGTVALRIPKRLEILRLWPKQKGYVGLFKNFARGTHREGELIPAEYEFRLAKGHPIGGQVVDVEGNPVAGVHVRVKVDNAPGVSTWLTDSFGQPVVKTDSEGRWQLGNAPPPAAGNEDDCSFEVKLSHDDYVTDKYWGESQRAQGIGTAELRRGDAKIVLHRGTSIQGTVVDHAGNPIAKGWVVWSDEPYFADGEYEHELHADGSFRTPPLPNKEFPITIVAPGFAAQRRLVEVASDAQEQRFELRPGHRITIHFVDTAGNPVPKVRVGIANSSDPSWQNSNALHNHDHPNVPDYGIPRSANKDGVFVWDWAPKEPVKYGIWAKGFAPKEVALVAKSEPHVITLSGARVVSGLVTDATTGKPIEEFQAMPVIVFRPNFLSTRYADVKRGTDGRYELPLRGSGDPNDRYRVRVEANGYRSLISEESFGPLDGQVELNVQLEPAPMRKGRILDALGKPVIHASVLEGTPTWVPHTQNGEPSGFRERVVQTDVDGRFELFATSEPVRLRVVHAAGIVEKLLQPEVDSIGDLQLQPWSRVSGRLVQNGQPIGNQTIHFNPTVDRGLGEARFQDRYSAQTEPDGSFAFDRLPPGAGSIKAYLGPWRDSPLTSAESLPVELAPGEHREVVLGGEGAVLTGQVIATGRDEVPLDRKYSLNYLVSRDRAIRELPTDFPALSFEPSSPMELSWSLDPHFSDWLATRENHFVKLTPDGELEVTGVAPGDFDLVIRLYEQPAGCLVETVGEKIVPVHVGGDDKIDLGKIEVPCRAGPRPGTDMGAFEFIDASGKKQSVYDMAGRHVVMHVWASWCAPCIESMPDIQHTADELSAAPVTFVGLNIDEDPSRAASLATRMNWSWSQNYLGEDSDMARQLAFSSVPTYYLIGPDGKLITSETSWGEIKNRLGEAFAAAAE